MSDLKATYRKYTLRFKRPGGTSRGILTTKDSWFVFLIDKRIPGRTGIGECSLISGLSIDDSPGFEGRLDHCCRRYSEEGTVDPALLKGFPAIRFGFEMAQLDLYAEQERILFPSGFTSGRDVIPINGLVWMGDPGFMKQQIREKLDQGYACLKLKIGALDFESEIALLKGIREEYRVEELEIRVDANGAFKPEEALKKLDRLSAFGLHSIEQPIRQGQPEEMERLCRQTPLPIALDEELIGIEEPGEKERLLSFIRPHYIILKPSLVGGLKMAEQWIRIADKTGTGWWVTSALESNIGLNAIAQWAFTMNNPMPQGLGTGQLYTNNIGSPLYISNGSLGYDPSKNWETDHLV